MTSNDMAVLILIVQLGLPCAVAWFLLKPLIFRLTKWEQTRRRQVVVGVVSLALVVGGIVFWAHHPIISCPPEYQEAFTPEKREKALELSRIDGNLMFPIHITVLDIQEDGEVSIETRYGFFGGVIGFQYDRADGLINQTVSPNAIYTILDVLVPLVILTVQLGLPCLVAWFLLKPLILRFTKWDRTRRRRVVVGMVSLLLVVGGLIVWITHPPIFCPETLALTPEQREEIRYHSKYRGGAFFPIAVYVLDIEGDGTVTFEIQYGFVGGTSIQEIGGPDGPDTIKKIH